MKFNDKKAIEIINKYNLNHSTFKVWKTRNKIPDRYFNDDYIHRQNLNKGDLIKQERLLNLLKENKINIKVFSELTNINISVFNELFRKDRKQINLSKYNLHRILNEIKRLKIEIAKSFESFSPIKLKNLFKNDLLHYSKIVEDRILIDEISYIRCREHEPDKILFEQIKNKYLIFALTLNI